MSEPTMFITKEGSGCCDGHNFIFRKVDAFKKNDTTHEVVFSLTCVYCGKDCERGIEDLQMSTILPMGYRTYL